MGNEQEFQDLLQHIAPDLEELRQRLRFLDWRQADNERLSRCAQRVERANQNFVDTLYQELADYPAPAAILGDPVITERLKQRQADYYRGLWQSPLDEAYVLERLRIGWVHQRTGVDLKWYLGAYRLYLDQLLGELLGSSVASDCFSSLIKKVFFDVGLALDSYGAAQRKALQDSEARYARAMRGANDGLWEWQLEQDQLYLSERWIRMLDLDRDSLSPTSRSWFGRVHGDDLPGLRQAIDNHLRGLTPSFIMNTVSVVRTAATCGCWYVAWPRPVAAACGAWPARRATSVSAAQPKSNCTMPHAMIRSPAWPTVRDSENCCNRPCNASNAPEHAKRPCCSSTSIASS